MKKILILLFFCSLNVSAADGLTLKLDDVSLTELVKIVYGDLKQQDFIIDSDLMKSETRFTINANKLNSKNIKPFLDKLLNREGFEINTSNGITAISKKEKLKDYETYIYTPKYRDTEYLTEAISNFLPKDAFRIDAPLNSTVQNTDVQTSGNSAFDIGNNIRDDILIQGEKETIDKFKMLVDKIDKPVDELVITTYIYEVTNGDSKDNGLSVTASLLGEKLGINLAGNILENLLSIRTFGLTAIISALKTDSRYKVLSSPFIRVRDRQEARFSVGSDVPVLGAVVTNNNGQTTQSVEYRQSGVILNITPRIHQDQYQLSINQELSNFVRTQSGVNNSPTLIKRSINTVVNATDDEVIILGGLDETKNTETTSGLSFLPFNTGVSQSNQKNSIILVMHVKKSNNSI